MPYSSSSPNHWCPNVSHGYCHCWCDGVGQRWLQKGSVQVSLMRTNHSGLVRIQCWPHYGLSKVKWLVRHTANADGQRQSMSPVVYTIRTTQHYTQGTFELWQLHSLLHSFIQTTNLDWIWVRHHEDREVEINWKILAFKWETASYFCYSALLAVLKEKMHGPDRWCIEVMFMYCSFVHSLELTPVTLSGRGNVYLLLLVTL